ARTGAHRRARRRPRAAVDQRRSLSSASRTQRLQRRLRGLVGFAWAQLLGVMDKPLIAIVRGHRVEPEVVALADALGRALVDAGFRIACGGLGGVMAAVSCGARSSASWTGAEVIGVMPGWSDDEQPNPWVDIALETGMGSLRNNVIARVADAAIAVGGG